MISKKTLAAACAAVLLVVGARSYGGPSLTAPKELSLENPVLLADAPTSQAASQPAAEPTPRRPIMAALHQAGVGSWLEKNGINIYGFGEFAYTHNFNKPDDKLNNIRVFDFEHDEPILGQADLTFERIVDPKKWDLGGRVEWIYGADAGLIHSNGLFDWYDSARTPENQWDLNQAYVDIGIPVGNGLTVRAGKFVTLLGQEVINPTGNALYSHSYLFGYAIPFTHTGVLGIYPLNDAWTITGGITRGWEQSVDDNNDAIDALGQVKWVINKQWTGIFNFVTGPERADNNDDWRTVLDLVVTFAPNDKWSFAVNGDFGWESNAVGDNDDATWYGIAAYATYVVCDYASISGRIEWFDDNDGTRTGTEANYYEITLGANFKPFAKDRWGQYLSIRPELRVDFSDEDVFNGGSDDVQFTFGIDVIYAL